MKNLSLVSLFILIGMCSAVTAQTDLEKALFELEGVIFKKIDTPEGFESAYELMVKQPLDHNDPSKGHFYQRVFLSHESFDAPNVMVTEGYNRDKNRIYEFSEYMQGNQIQIEHRFFGKSVPENIDYNYLNLKQATADLHHINLLFKKIYHGPYLSTGISKGGMTTLFYRYFYPEDVDVSVPYVAPINVEYKDKRIYTFLDTVGTDDCRKKIENYQKDLLKNKDEFMPYIKGYAHGKGLTFDQIEIDEAYEYAVLEYSFSHWQMGNKCEDVPSAGDNYYVKAKHFMDIIGVDFYSDKDVNVLAPFYYQMGTEMGYYGFETDEFKPYLTQLGDEPSAVFAPDGVTTTFDPTLTVTANHWFETQLEYTIYINGASDTWSATAVAPDKKLDVLVYNMEGENHRSARIKNLTADQKVKLEQKLEEWLKIDVAAYIPTPKP